MTAAYLAGIAYHLPERVVTNAELQAENPSWEMDRIASKVGITARHIAAPDETAADLGYAAAEKLLTGMHVDRGDIEYVLFCSQSPDYALPTTACVLQDRLRLRTTCGALDFNQGCSGYVYGLHLAHALIAAEQVRTVLLITAETYSKYIHPRDRSVRVLFGDGASASLISAAPAGARIGSAVLGTDGSGSGNLVVPAGGARRPACAATKVEVADANGSVRTAEHLFMDGQELFLFTLRRVPEVVDATLHKAGLTRADVHWYVFHQANAFMNEHLRAKLKIPRERAPVFLETVGNTVSSTIPIALREVGTQFCAGDRVMCVGFGVGYSWGACMLEWADVALV